MCSKGCKVKKAENRSVFCPKRLVETEMVPVWRLLQREPGEDTPTFADWLKQRLEEWKTQVVKDQALKIMLY